MSWFKSIKQDQMLHMGLTLAAAAHDCVRPVEPDERSPEVLKEAWTKTLFEVVFCLLHLVDRWAFSLLGPEKRALLCDRLGPIVSDAVIESEFADRSEEDRKHLSDGFYAGMNAATVSYSQCRQPLGGEFSEGIFGRLLDKLVAILIERSWDSLAAHEIVRRAMEAYQSLQIPDMLRGASEEL